MDTFREAAYRRWSRQAWTIVHAVRAGRVRAKVNPGRAVAPVDGEALRGLAATVAADARLVRVPQRPPGRLVDDDRADQIRPAGRQVQRDGRPRARPDRHGRPYLQCV